MSMIADMMHVINLAFRSAGLQGGPVAIIVEDDDFARIVARVKSEGYLLVDGAPAPEEARWVRVAGVSFTSRSHFEAEPR